MLFDHDSKNSFSLDVYSCTAGHYIKETKVGTGGTQNLDHEVYYMLALYSWEADCHGARLGNRDCP